MSAAVNIPDLRPLSLGELLDRTFTYYRRNFWLFFGIMAIPQVFVIAANLCLEAMGRLAMLPAAKEGSATPATVAIAGIFGFFAGLTIMVLAYWLLYSVALGATTHAISAAYLGRLTTVRESYRSMKGQIRRIMDLFITVGIRMFGVVAVSMGGFVAAVQAAMEIKSMGLVAGLGILLALFGIIASIVLAVWLVLRYGVSVPALVLEKLRAKEAIRRSVFLTRGNLGRVFLIGVLMTLVSATVSGLLQGPFIVATMVLAIKNKGAAPFWLNIPATVAGGIGQALTGPLLMIGLVLLYYDARVRKEGLDLQLIMEALDHQGVKQTQP